MNAPSASERDTRISYRETMSIRCRRRGFSAIFRVADVVPTRGGRGEMSCKMHDSPGVNPAVCTAFDARCGDEMLAPSGCAGTEWRRDVCRDVVEERDFCDDRRCQMQRADSASGRAGVIGAHRSLLASLVKEARPARSPGTEVSRYAEPASP
jgi:hypothetical protein